MRRPASMLSALASLWALWHRLGSHSCAQCAQCAPSAPRLGLLALAAAHCAVGVELLQPDPMWPAHPLPPSPHRMSGSRLLNLINDILDAASMRVGKLVIKHEKVNMYNLANDVIDLCQPLAKRNVKLINTVGSDLPPVLGDMGRIVQIFHNLVGNSCKFTSQGSVTISAEVVGDKMEISVTDTGIGIPESRFEQIFLAFEQ
eukprot:104833-Chlamydomonas_euryale.AAC.3